MTKVFGFAITLVGAALGGLAVARYGAERPLVPGAILLAVVFYLQQEFTPKPPATTPEQVQQQKMMKWMTLLFPIFLYNGPSGLNIYILTSTTIGIIESKRIRDHIKEREEAEKAGKVIVDAKPTRNKSTSFSLSFRRSIARSSYCASVTDCLIKRSRSSSISRHTPLKSISRAPWLSAARHAGRNRLGT